MKRFAVVGNPVAHSLSPVIQAAFAEAAGIRQSYDILFAPLDEFAATVGRFFDAGGSGLNVTVPFKEQAAAWVDILDPAAATAGAVNTIVAADGRFRGHNTDGAGLVRDLYRRGGVPLKGARVLLLGAGGAARGALRPLLEAGPGSLVIANRTAGRARGLAAEIGVRGADTHVEGVGLSDVRGRYDVIVNATSAGMSGDTLTGLSDGAVRGALCYDMVYLTGDDGLTGFGRWALRHGARRAVDGLGMLVEQAALAFELWHGVAPATEPVLELLRQRQARAPLR